MDKRLLLILVGAVCFVIGLFVGVMIDAAMTGTSLTFWDSRGMGQSDVATEVDLNSSGVAETGKPNLTFNWAGCKPDTEGVGWQWHWVERFNYGYWYSPIVYKIENDGTDIARNFFVTDVLKPKTVGGTPSVGTVSHLNFHWWDSMGEDAGSRLEYWHSSLAVGETTTGTFVAKIPGLDQTESKPPGSFALTLKVDGWDMVDESNEDDNTIRVLIDKSYDPCIISTTKFDSYGDPVIEYAE